MAEYLNHQEELEDEVGEYLNRPDYHVNHYEEEAVVVKDVDTDADDVDSMSPPVAYTKLWKLIHSIHHCRRKKRRRIRKYKYSSDYISGAGRKDYGPLNESAPGWDKASIDHLMSNDVPQQELAQPNVPALDMTKEYLDRFFGFLPPKLLHNINNHEKSRRRQRIDTYFRSEHGRLPPRISKLLCGSFTPP